MYLSMEPKSLISRESLTPPRIGEGVSLISIAHILYLIKFFQVNSILKPILGIEM